MAEEVALAARWDARFPSSPQRGDGLIDLCWVEMWLPQLDRDGGLDGGKVSAGAEGGEAGAGGDGQEGLAVWLGGQ